MKYMANDLAGTPFNEAVDEDQFDLHNNIENRLSGMDGLLDTHATDDI